MFSFMRQTALLILLATLASLPVACGSSKQGDGLDGAAGAQPTPVQRVFLNDRVFTVDDLKTAGMKVMNDYDVSGLEKAVSAYHLAFNKIEYEARLYLSHADAVNVGQPWADDISGDDGVVIGGNVKWQEGASHRRLCSRAAETPHSGCSYSPRYGDYVITGNLILLCEGVDTEHSMRACDDVLKNLK
ncbi:MAG: hypothetical protein EXR57_06605 [Dehalococcoidia bacterium]|nr:hypothetical protein [Dehalococcoidia bacterium]